MSESKATLADVLITAQLAQASSRVPDHAAENRALGVLAEAVAEPGNGALQRLVEFACELCDAESGGVSIPDGAGDRTLLWCAVTGPLAANAGASIPRAACPCGTALDRDETMLFQHPERHFDYGSLVTPPMAEVLVTPCHAGGKAVATLWVAAHSEGRRFDAESARLLESLARFASSAIQAMRRSAERGATGGLLKRGDVSLAEALRAMSSLHRLWTGTADPTTLLEDVLDAAIEIAGADLGNIQLCDAQQQTIEIKAQRGFDPAFLELIRVTGIGANTASARAIRERKQVVIEDVGLEPTYAPYLQLAAHAGFRGLLATPLQSRGGEVVGVLCTHFRGRCDPSETQLQSLELYAQLIADVIERARLLEAMEVDDRRKTEFLATLAHELRNPLAPIRNAVRLLQLRGSDAAIAEQSRAVIERQLAQLVRLVDDLLDVARISTGKLDLRRERVDLSKIIRIAVETSRPLVEAGEHELIVQLPHYPIYVDADTTRLAQVLLNLINNAAKYSDRRGWILVTAAREGNEAVIRVKDRGIGIDPALLGQIFDLFMQVDRSIERSRGGLGVGLTLVKRVVELHGGRIEVRSEGAGLGCEFITRLPLSVAVTAPAVVASASGGEREARPHRVLIVDDNADAAESLSLIVSLSGHETRTAADGIQALEVARVFDPDLMVLDLGLPRLSGYEVARRIRADPALAHVTIVALTGWGQPEDRHRGREAGIDHYMVKPADLAALERILNDVPVPEAPRPRGHVSPQPPPPPPEASGTHPHP